MISPDRPATRILIVDDERAQTAALSATLRDEGYDTVGMHSPREALGAIRPGNFDILIADLMMPGIDGIALISEARKTDPDLMSIVMTGHGSVNTAVEAMKAGAFDYILKPFNLDTILPVLARATSVRNLSLENSTLARNVANRTQELEAANRRLNAANKELEAYAYTVSHDLRAPLRAIEGFAQIVLENFSRDLPDEAQGYLGQISSQVRRMDQLISDLLRLSQLGRQPLMKVAVDVNELVRTVLQELHAAEPARSVTVRMGFLPTAVADPSLLRQVFVNLLSNAFKYTRNRTDAAVEITGESAGDEVVYTIRDNGAGFDMQYVDRIFGIFQRLHRDDEFEGTGVGLSIVQRIIERHGGTITAVGEVDQGAVFTFSIKV
jgi:signal transduction histidine kinase